MQLVVGPLEKRDSTVGFGCSCSGSADFKSAGEVQFMPGPAISSWRSVFVMPGR